MKTTISLLVLFILVLGGGYAYNKQATQKAMEESAAGSTASSTESTGAASPSLAPESAPESDSSGGESGSAGTGNEAAAPGTYTLAQVGAHATAGNCWTAINGNVYNLTDWIAKHPGGAARIIAICGKDGSQSFSGKHGADANAQAALANFKIGVLAS